MIKKIGKHITTHEQMYEWSGEDGKLMEECILYYYLDYFSMTVEQSDPYLVKSAISSREELYDKIDAVISERDAV